MRTVVALALGFGALSCGGDDGGSDTPEARMCAALERYDNLLRDSDTPIGELNEALDEVTAMQEQVDRDVVMERCGDLVRGPGG